jgi:hypothetical protein
LRLEKSISNCASVTGCGRSVDIIEEQNQRGRGIGISHGTNQRLKKTSCESSTILNDGNAALKALRFILPDNARASAPNNKEARRIFAKTSSRFQAT